VARLRRDLGTIESYAALVGILIGAGIFKVTSESWALTGPSVILAQALLLLPILATSVGYSVCLSTPLGTEPGGEYTHISRTFGGRGVASWGVAQDHSYLGALAFLAPGFRGLPGRAFPAGARAAPIRTTMAVASLVPLFVHAAGVRWFGRIQVAMVALLGLSVAVVVLPGLFAIHAAYYRPFFTHGASDSRPHCRRCSSSMRASNRWPRRRVKSATAGAGCRASSCADCWPPRAFTC
jgi:hypothetical protein